MTRWETPEAMFDELPNSMFDVAIDFQGGETAIVYVAVRRIGVVVLRFDPTLASADDRLQIIERIQTGEHASAVHLRENGDGTRHLLVSDYAGGIRLYGADEQ